MALGRLLWGYLTRRAPTAVRHFASVRSGACSAHRGFTTGGATIKSILDADLLVCDMAGTTIEEEGMVYSTLRKAINDDGMHCSVADMHEWHGAKKETVIEHFARVNGTHKSDVSSRVARVGDRFTTALHEVYSETKDKIRIIHPNLLLFFDWLRAKGVKVALNTGYPPEIQMTLIQCLKLEDHIDAFISAYDVPQGRPYPYMIHTLMQKLCLSDVRRVVKAGDTVRDIEEGKNAGCGLVVGVLSGADDERMLSTAGADLVVGFVHELMHKVK